MGGRGLSDLDNLGATRPHGAAVWSRDLDGALRSAAVPLPTLAGDLTAMIAPARMTLSGSSDNDTLNGGAGDDLLQGLDGRDDLNGFAGDDSLEGGAGGDRMTGGAGAHSLFGGADNDVMIGNDGRDVLHGGAGNDTFYEARSEDGDHYFGEDGDDYIEAATPAEGAIAPCASTRPRTDLFNTIHPTRTFIASALGPTRRRPGVRPGAQDCSRPIAVP